MDSQQTPDDLDSAKERSESGDAVSEAMEDTQEQAAEEREQARGYQ